MKKYLVTVLAVLAITSSLFAADIEVKYSGPSGQGDMIWYSSNNSKTNLVLTSNGVDVTANSLKINNVTITSSNDVTVYGTNAVLNIISNSIIHLTGPVYLEGGTNTVSGTMILSGTKTISGSAATITCPLTISGKTNAISGGLTLSGDAVSCSASFTLSGGTNNVTGPLISSGGQTLTGTTALNGTTTIAGGTNTISGALTISGASTITGGGTISGSALSITAPLTASGGSNIISGAGSLLSNATAKAYIQKLEVVSGGTVTLPTSSVDPTYIKGGTTAVIVIGGTNYCYTNGLLQTAL